MKKMLLIPGVMMMLMLASPVINTAYAQTKKKASPAKAGGKAADIAAGKDLVSKSDCLACHKLDVKLVGPAYIDVAKKYPATEANYAKLAKKVVEGGAGVWGEIPMSPHPAVSLVDAKKMVKYVLSVK
ncbi:MAG: c-type cytochrome [Mucilaginibacter sp.]